jgi:hypothetical protein
MHCVCREGREENRVNKSEGGKRRRGIGRGMHEEGEWKRGDVSDMEREEKTFERRDERVGKRGKGRERQWTSEEN